MGFPRIVLYCIFSVFFFEVFPAKKLDLSSKNVVNRHNLKVTQMLDNFDYGSTEDERPILVILRGKQSSVKPSNESCDNGVQTIKDAQYYQECYKKSEVLCIEACKQSFEACVKLDYCVNKNFTTGKTHNRFTPDEVANDLCKQNCLKVIKAVESQSVDEEKLKELPSNPEKQTLLARPSNKKLNIGSIHLKLDDMPYKGYRRRIKCNSTDKNCLSHKTIKNRADSSSNHDRYTIKNKPNIAELTDENTFENVNSKKRLRSKAKVKSDDTAATISISFEPTACDKNKLNGKSCPFEKKSKKRLKRKKRPTENTNDLNETDDSDGQGLQDDNQSDDDITFVTKKRRKCPINKILKGKRCVSKKKSKTNINSGDDTIISISINPEQGDNDNQIVKKCPFNKNSNGERCITKKKFKKKRLTEKTSDSISVDYSSVDESDNQEEDDNQIDNDISFVKKKKCRKGCKSTKRLKAKKRPSEIDSDSSDYVISSDDYDNQEQQDDITAINHDTGIKKKIRICNKINGRCVSKKRGINRLPNEISDNDSNEIDDPEQQVDNQFDFDNINVKKKKRIKKNKSVNELMDIIFEEQDDNYINNDDIDVKKKSKKCPFNKKGKSCGGTESVITISINGLNDNRHSRKKKRKCPYSKHLKGKKRCPFN